MEEVEVLTNERGALKAFQHYKLRFSLTRVLPEGFARHRVVQWPRCSGLSKSAPEAKFNCLLMFFFLVALSAAVLNVILSELALTHNLPPYTSTRDYIFDQTWLFGHFHIRRVGIVLLAVFAAVVLVGVLAKKAMKGAGLAPPRREEVQTVSALIQQV